ncbi:MAG: GldG family protein [Lachnospiraceae bacterium]|nr:GldG family protein [Lachnospiraceae bacterium]
MKAENQNKSENKVKGQIALKRGSYAFVIGAVVLAILIAVNLLVAALPKTVTRLDISSSRLYSITSATKVVVNNLQKDVTIYWIVQADQEDEVIENLLEKYDSLSNHISVVKKNPDIYPQFAQQYTDQTVQNNSLIVECGQKSRFISYDDIYISDVDYSTYSTVYSFDGEGAVTSAIDYVVSETLPVVYILEGHGEQELPAILTDQIGKENMELKSFSLINEDEIPEDASCLPIYAPESDISEEEAGLLKDYLASGGKLFILAGPVEDGILTNLASIAAAYGAETAEGIVIEGDRGHYAFQAPYILLPDIASDEITDPLIESRYYVIVPTAAGMTVTGSSAVSLLNTSDDAFSKVAGYALTTYDKEEGDIDGRFSLAVLASDASGGQLVYISSSRLLDETVNAYSSGANLDLCMNALSALVGENEAVAIRQKSLSYNYLTISEDTASTLKIMMIGVLPAAFAVIGIIVLISRRSRRNAQA